MHDPEDPTSRAPPRDHAAAGPGQTGAGRM